jgi:hypothetical protein
MVIRVRKRNTKKKKKKKKPHKTRLMISRPIWFRIFVPKDDWTGDSVRVSVVHLIALVGLVTQ